MTAIDAREWDRARCEEQIQPGEAVEVGFDVGWKWDATALVPLRRGRTFRLLGTPVILVPPRDGGTLCEDLVMGGLRKVAEAFRVVRVTMNVVCAERLAVWIEDDLGIPVVDHGGSIYRHAADYARFVDGLRDHTLRHTGDPSLRAHVLKADAQQVPGGEYRFARPNTARGQERPAIDALTAAAMVA